MPWGRLTGTVVLALALLPSAVAHAAVPQVDALWASDVASTSARLHADLSLDVGLSSKYQFGYLTEATYQANIKDGKDPFAGDKVQPPAEANIKTGTAEASVVGLLANLTPQTTYRYRVVVKNSSGTTTSEVNSFTTQGSGGGTSLPDGRGWEMVSPVDKNGGQVDAAGANAGGGVLQGATNGDSATFSSAASFAGGEGAPPASQYVSRRGGSGWSTENLTVPIFSGSYGTEPEGVPWRIFSGDLIRGVLLNGSLCRSAEGGCGVVNPPLSGSGAPTGYQNYYLRQGGGFEALVDSTDVLATALTPDFFEVSLAGATADLTRIVLSSCAALTANATEVPDGEGCDSEFQNLYLWSGGALTLLNLLPSEALGNPGAELGAQLGAISTDGSRVYWRAPGSGNLYLRTGAQTKQVDASVGGEGSFETASSDGATAYFTKAGHLYRYNAVAGTATDLTPGGDVEGVLGASADGSRVYYLSATGLFLREGGLTTEVAAGADASNYPPASGTARLTASGGHLVFVSNESLTGYDNTGPGGEPLTEVFLYEESTDTLTCVSCNPSNARPVGPSTVPGAIANGEGPRATQAYKPRALSSDGRRVYFDSEDALVLSDTNSSPDVYQWEDQGKGSCSASGGCLALISSGKAEIGAFFFDAAADGNDVFFRTDRSLVGDDPGSIDLYDARVGGGFPVPRSPLPCEGDACQSLPSEPIDPTLNTLIEGSGNPPVRFFDTNRRRPIYHRLRNHHHKRKGKKGNRGNRGNNRGGRR